MRDTSSSRFLARHGRGVVAPEQQEAFLEAVAAGARVDAAALDLGLTASRFRTLAANDPEFKEAYRFAKDERNRAHRAKIRARLDVLAFGDSPTAFAALRMQAEMYLPELEHKRSKIVRHGNDGSPFQIQAVLPTVSQEALDAMPLDELEALVDKLRALADGDVETLRALPGGQS